jgi:hypothetical protein
MLHGGKSPLSSFPEHAVERRFRALLIALIALAGCRDRPTPEASRAGTKPPAAATRDLAGPFAAPCTAAAAWWQEAVTPADSAQLTRVDTVVVPPLGEQPTAGCRVRLWLPHGMRQGEPPRDGNEDSVPLALQRSGAGWRRMIDYDADGPDGSLSGYQRGQVRCAVEQSWDGGDGTDSTYVPEVWYRRELTCWAEPSDGGSTAINGRLPR